MHALVNGIRLFFDVEGAGLVPDGPTMREKPVMLLLHGGPGAGTGSPDCRSGRAPPGATGGRRLLRRQREPDQRR